MDLNSKEQATGRTWRGCSRKGKHPEVGAGFGGTQLGISHCATVAGCRKAGITAVIIHEKLLKEESLASSYYYFFASHNALCQFAHASFRLSIRPSTPLLSHSDSSSPGIWFTHQETSVREMWPLSLKTLQFH